MILVDRPRNYALFRGPRPSGFDEMREMGIAVDFNLETGWFEFFHGEEKQEKGWCQTLDISYYNREMSDFSAPTPEFLINMVAQIHNAMNCGNVLVHCLHGEDRTGMIIAAYRMLQQMWTFQQARDEMFSLGFHKFPYLFWVDALTKVKS